MKITTRPELCGNLDLRDFDRHYWLKDELAAFCRENGLRTYGSKAELTSSIQRFLRGEPPATAICSKGKTKRLTHGLPLSLDTVITTDYTNNQRNRAFFASVIGTRFHFTTRFMNYCRNNPDKTYRDAVGEWYREQEERKRGEYRPEITPQFEYNRFIQAYFRENPGKSMKEAVEAWWRRRAGVEVRPDEAE